MSAATPSEVDIGMVHGRYQPFHREHLECVLAAAARCRGLVVGITAPDDRSLVPEAADPKRHLPDANPFSYYERARMIEAATRLALPDRELTIVPFPIDRPGLWGSYVPPGTTHYVRVLSPWGREKVRRLRAHGQQVVALDGECKRVSGSLVRAAMRGGGEWRSSIPEPVASVIAGLPAARLRAEGLDAVIESMPATPYQRGTELER